MISTSDFDKAVGQVFSVETAAGPVSLELVKVDPIANSPRDGGGFSLLFKGPRAMILPQAAYRFAGKDFAHDIFIVPVSADADSTVYQAVFN